MSRADNSHHLQRAGVTRGWLYTQPDLRAAITGLSDTRISIASTRPAAQRARRFSRSEQAVRHTGQDVSVDSSDRRRAGGLLSRQGPQTLRWALCEAAKNSSHLRSPDHDYYAAVKTQHDGKIVAISVARKLARRCNHVLREVDPELVYAIPA